MGYSVSGWWCVCCSRSSCVPPCRSNKQADGSPLAPCLGVDWYLKFPTIRSGGYTGSGTAGVLWRKIPRLFWAVMFRLCWCYCRHSRSLYQTINSFAKWSLEDICMNSRRFGYHNLSIPLFSWLRRLSVAERRSFQFSSRKNVGVCFCHGFCLRITLNAMARFPPTIANFQTCM